MFCEKVRDAWKNSEFWDFIKPIQRLSLEDMCGAIWDSMGEEGVEKWLFKLWASWKCLREFKHSTDGVSFVRDIQRSDAMLKVFKDARHSLTIKQRILPNEGAKDWYAPPPGSFRLDVDVSFREDGQKVGAGFIVRDSSGIITLAGARPIGFTPTVLLGELHAMMIAIGFCLEQDIGPVFLFSDSLLAIHVLQDERGGSDSLCDDLWEVFEHARKYVVLEFCHARRSANRAAHALAASAVVSQGEQTWTSNFPVWLLDIVNSDLV
ncbi:uncharacterized protein LOC131012944 [Salvia miltiorrhiza]|uniref:uncharacterized protein LOC131012944 n=1 Tax=Salvia miltiorrhiza TaxID=226208 RepID=UPI0025AD3CB6|nr:uncharacterized protein LOC131012944 [Salvia miltiorrhiza]